MLKDSLLWILNYSVKFVKRWPYYLVEIYFQKYIKNVYYTVLYKKKYILEEAE